MTGTTAFELLWGEQQRPRRGPKPSLSLERIVTEAIALADSAGLESLSMQQLSERLGCAKMALYRYVPGKSELTALMLDGAMGDAPDLVAAAKNSTEEPWRAQMRAWTVSTFEWHCAHPWTMEIILRSRLFGPNEIGWFEAALAALAPLGERGLTGPERLDTLVLLSGHARILAQATAHSNSGDMESEMVDQLTRTLATRGADFPHTLAAFTEPNPPETRDNALNFGIDRILDGLEALIATRRS